MKTLKLFGITQAFSLIFLFTSACGVKGAPMPRREEMFISPSRIKRVQKKKELKKELEEKMVAKKNRERNRKEKQDEIK